MNRPDSPAQPTPPSPRELDPLIDGLRTALAHYLASGSERSANAARHTLDRLALLLDASHRATACGGDLNRDAALGELLSLLSRQAIAPGRDDARRIARSFEALSHADVTSPALRERLVRLGEDWRVRERRAGDLEASRGGA